MSKTIRLFGLAVAAASFAGPALAGPVGSGLGLTEEVMRKASRTVTVAAAGEACAAQAREALKDHPAVAEVVRSASALRVTFQTAAHAAEHRSTVSATVARACG